MTGEAARVAESLVAVFVLADVGSFASAVNIRSAIAQKMSALVSDLLYSIMNGESASLNEVALATRPVADPGAARSSWSAAVNKRVRGTV